MATYYWVGGAGTWNNTNTANWSTSSGGSSGAGPPTSADDVIFNSSSDNNANFTVSLSTTASCRDLTVTAPDRTITFSGSQVNCYGNFTMSSTNTTTTGMDIDFLATTTGKTVTSGSKTFRRLRVNGAGGEWTQTDAIAWSGAAGNFTFSAGTWKTGNFNMTGGDMEFTTAGTKEIQLGSSTVTLSNGKWYTAGSSNLTVTAGTSTISLGATNPIFEGDGKTYYNLSQTNASAGVNFLIYGANTFNNVTITALTATGARRIFFYANQTISGTFSCNGASAIRRVHLLSDTIGTRRTLTVNAFAASPADICLRDIGVAGTASPLSGTRIGDAGNNTGITATAAANKYWNLTGSVDFTATGWALTSNGTPAVNNFPLPQDTIFFTNSGAMGTVGVNADWCVGPVDMSARTNAGTFNITNSNLQIHGNITLGTGITWAGTGSRITVASPASANYTIDTNGVNLGSYVDIDMVNATLTLAENTNFSRTGSATINVGIRLASGTLDLNSNTLTIASGFICIANQRNKTLAFGVSGKIVHNNAAGADYVFYIGESTGLTLTGNKLVEATGNSSTTRYIDALGGLSESNTVSVNITNGTGGLSFGGGSRFINLNTQGYTGTQSLGQTTEVELYGSLTIGTGHTPSATTGTIKFIPSTAQTLTSNGRTINCGVEIAATGANGKITLADALTLGTGSGANLTITSGQFDSGNFAITGVAVFSNNVNTRSVTFGTSSISLSGAASNNLLDFRTTTGLTFSGASSTVTFTADTSSTRDFYTGGLTWGSFIIGSGATNSIVTIRNGGTFTGTISSTKTGNHTIQFDPDVTVTVAGWTVSGSAGNLVSLHRRTTGVTGEWNIAKSGGGVVSADYLSISNSNATPATLTWYAGANSTDGGNNTGWIFTAPPAPGNGNFFMLLR